MYAVNATSEPKSTKYAVERLERRDTLAGLKPAHSFEMRLATKNIALPMSICIAVESCEDLGKGALLEYREPIAQDRVAPTTINAPTNGTGLPPEDNPPCPTSRITPKKPIAIPTTTPFVGLTPFGLSASMRTIHRGTVPTRTAAIPEGTVCSAHTTPPFPPKRRSPPTAAAAFQLRSDGRSEPRDLAQT